MNTLLNALIRGGVYSVLRRLPLRFVLVLAGIALVVVVAASQAHGATVFATSCPTPSDPITDTQAQCAALAERLVAIEAHADTSMSAVVDARSLLGYLVGLVVSLLFAAIFLRTFARNV